MIFILLFTYAQIVLHIYWSDVLARLALKLSREGAPATASGSRFHVGMVPGMKECFWYARMLAWC